MVELKDMPVAAEVEVVVELVMRVVRMVPGMQVGVDQEKVLVLEEHMALVVPEVVAVVVAVVLMQPEGPVLMQAVVVAEVVEVMEVEQVEPVGVEAEVEEEVVERPQVQGELMQVDTVALLLIKTPKLAPFSLSHFVHKNLKKTKHEQQ